MSGKQKKEFDLTRYLSADHKLVIKSLRRLENYLHNPETRSELKKAAELLNTMKREMNTHFRKEEEILFPVLNRHFERAFKKMDREIRPNGGPINVMFLEHKSMRMIIQNLEKAVENEKSSEISGFVTQFGALLRSHVFREENVLYVVANAKLKEKEKAQVAKRLELLS